MDIASVIGIGLFLSGIYLWKKYNDRKFFWLLFPVGTNLLLSVYKWFSITYLNLDAQERTADRYGKRVNSYVGNSTYTSNMTRLLSQLSSALKKLSAALKRK